MDYFRAFHAGEALVEAQVAVGEAFVVDAEAMEDGCIQVVYVNRVLQDVVGEVVGLAIFEALLDASASHPHGECSAMVVRVPHGCPW